MHKRVISLIIAFVMIGSLMAGCGNKDDNTPSAQSSTQAAQSSTQAEQSQKDPVSLTYVTWMNKPDQDQQSLDAFMKDNPDIKVETQIIDGTSYDNLLKTRILSGDAPDLMLLQTNLIKAYAEQNYILDLSEEPIFKKVEENAMLPDIIKVNGKYYAFPLAYSFGSTYVNYDKKYFEKLGLTPPKTVEEFDAILQKIKADGKDPLVWGGKDAWTLQGFTNGIRNNTFLSQFPKDNYQDAIYEGKLKYSDYSRSGLQYLADLNAKGYVSKATMTLTWDQSVQYFADQKAALLAINGPWVPTHPAVQNATNLDIGVFSIPMPLINGKNYTGVGTDRNVTISAETKKMDAAKTLFRYLTSADVNADYCTRQQLNTLVPGTAEKVQVPEVFKEYFEVAGSDLYVLCPSPNAKYPFVADVLNAFSTACQNVLVGSPVDTELEKLDVIYEKYRDQMGKK